MCMYMCVCVCVDTEPCVIAARIPGDVDQGDVCLYWAFCLFLCKSISLLPCAPRPSSSPMMDQHTIPTVHSNIS